MNQSKELFEKLGYYVDTDDDYCISYMNKEANVRVIFYYEDRMVYVLKVAHINMPLLQAINKQCEELNWGEENGTMS